MYLRLLASWLLALLVVIWRRTCRYRIIDDPRQALRQQGRAYAYALLHAHQIAGVFVSDEPTLAAMVSRSADGDLLVPSLCLRHIRAVRGSTRKGQTDKGGRAALNELAKVAASHTPILLAVDGPRGPRGHVHRGIADLAVAENVVILPTLALPSRRWILSRTWDRMQLPRPFCTISLVFGTPIATSDRDKSEKVRQDVEQALRQLETRYDPDEHKKCVEASSDRPSSP